jgi:hypothetical protein
MLMQAQKGRGIFKLGTRRGWVVTTVLYSLYPRKDPVSIVPEVKQPGKKCVIAYLHLVHAYKYVMLCLTFAHTFSWHAQEH